MSLPFDPKRLEDLAIADKEARENLEHIHGREVAAVICELAQFLNFALVIKDVVPPLHEPMLHSISEIIGAVASVTKKDKIALAKDVKAAADRRKF